MFLRVSKDNCKKKMDNVLGNVPQKLLKRFRNDSEEILKSSSK